MMYRCFRIRIVNSLFFSLPFEYSLSVPFKEESSQQLSTVGIKANGIILMPLLDVSHLIAMQHVY